MKALLFGDLHASHRSLLGLKKIIQSNPQINCLIFVGDAVNMGEPIDFIQLFIKFIKESEKDFFWVPGNNDFGKSYEVLYHFKPSLEGCIQRCQNISITGVGGSPDSWSGQYPGENKKGRVKISDSIFLSHIPPPGIYHWSKKDFASPAQPELISPKENDKKKSMKNNFFDAPLVHICGHIHHTWGINYVGKTKVIKLAASALGHFAIMDLETFRVEFGEM